jgi:hypothetical protein
MKTKLQPKTPNSEMKMPISNENTEHENEKYVTKNTKLRISTSN